MFHYFIRPHCYYSYSVCVCIDVSSSSPSVLQNAVETESSSGEKPVLFLLLKMLVSSRNAPLRRLTKRLVLKVSNAVV